MSTIGNSPKGCMSSNFLILVYKTKVPTIVDEIIQVW
jgi:hypothetical protein